MRTSSSCRRGFDRIRSEWAERIGSERVRALEQDLVALGLAEGGALRLDAPGWFGGAG